MIFVNKSAMKLLTIVFCLLILINCKPEKQPQSEAAAAAEAPATPEIIIEDPFSGTNLVDNIKLVDLNNEPIDLKQYQGKKIFLNFWATWCKPCIVEMPSIERAQKELAEEDYIFLLASDEPIGRIKRFQATKDFNLKFIRVETPFPDIGILSLPTTLIIDEQGKIALNQIGALEWDAPVVLDKLRSVSM